MLSVVLMTAGLAAAKVNKIEVTTPPTKTAYFEGDKFDPAGMVVTATYSDKTTANVTGKCTYSTPSGKLSAPSTTVTITYKVSSTKKYTTTTVVTVSAKLVTGIEVTAPPTNTAYVEGQTFNPAGMIVTATYNSGSKEAITGYTCGPTPLTTTTTAATVTYTTSYATFTATTPVTVSAKAITGISVTKNPDKDTKSYYEGQIFNPAGMIVSAIYNDGTSAPVTGYTVDLTDTTPLTTSMTAVTLTYTTDAGTFTTTLPITVKAKAVTEIKVTTPPAKTAYVEGQVFDPTGMVVTASYNDGTKAAVKDYAYSPTGNFTKKTTKQPITISYTFGGVTKTAAINVSVSARAIQRIDVTTPPATTTYLEWQTFDKTGMVVTATYNDGSTENIDGYYVSKTPLATWVTSVSITYKTYKTSTAVTVIPKAMAPAVMLSNYVLYDTEKNPGYVVMDILGTFMIPSGCHVTEYGFITLKNPASDPGTSLTLATAGTTVLQANETSDYGQVFRSILTEFGSVFYVRGYVTFDDGAGHTLTLYSHDVVKAVKY
jgi:hypothetical protein